jgi:type IV pilus assembly protein PilX
MEHSRSTLNVQVSTFKVQDCYLGTDVRVAKPATRNPKDGTRNAPKRQRGTVLFIALIVLVAMTLAGIAIMRSVDTATLIAGNLAFKQGTIQSSDNGVEQAYQWLLANRAVLANTNTGAGYYSSRPGSEPNWNDPLTWASAVSLGTDAAGNTTSYVIHRLCNCPDTLYNGTCASGPAQQCALTSASNVAPPPGQGDSFAVGASGYLEDPKVFYRITVRTQGPRNTTSFVQSMVAIAL